MSGARVRARRFAPPEDLADVVDALWIGRWDLRGQPPHETELLSDPCVHVVFEGGDGEQAGSRVVGVWTGLWRRTLRGRGYVRGAKLRAGAAGAIVDWPIAELTDRVVSLDAVLGEDVAALEREILDPIEERDALAVLARWLRDRRRADLGGQRRVAAALVAAIAADPELTTVARLAGRVGQPARSLQRLFREHVGAPPKWVIRRYRLQEAALRIERGDPITLAALAADLGYADHAHLARDFKSAVGRSPSEFAASVWR